MRALEANRRHASERLRLSSLLLILCMKAHYSVNTMRIKSVRHYESKNSGNVSEIQC